MEVGVDGKRTAVRDAHMSDIDSPSCAVAESHGLVPKCSARNVCFASFLDSCNVIGEMPRTQCRSRMNNCILLQYKLFVRHKESENESESLAPLWRERPPTGGR